MVQARQASLRSAVPSWPMVLGTRTRRESTHSWMHVLVYQPITIAKCTLGMQRHAYRQRLVPVVQYMGLVNSMQMLMKCSMVDQNRTIRKYFRWYMLFNHMCANLWFVPAALEIFRNL